MSNLYDEFATATLKCLDKIKSDSKASLKSLDKFISSKNPFTGTNSERPMLALLAVPDKDK